MIIIINLYDVEIDLVKIESFYKTFPIKDWKLSVKKFGKEEIFTIGKNTINQKDDNQTNNEEFETSLSYLGIKYKNNIEYNISLKKTLSGIKVEFDNFYSFIIESGLLENNLFELIAKLHGFEACECSGFTVKNKEGTKFQPKEIIYVQNKLGVVFPRSFAYSKHKLDKKQVKSLTNKFHVYCPSPILQSILSSTPLCFITDGVVCSITCIGSKYFLNMSSLEKVEMYSLEERKLDKIEDWFKKNKNKLTPLLHKIYVENKTNEFKKLNKNTNNLRKIIIKEINFLQKFFTIVPFFYDKRDSVTNKIINIITNFAKTEKVNIKTDYLIIKKKTIIDRTPMFSLKAWEEQ